MKLPRRHVLCLAAGAAAFPIVTRIASAQTYPSRPVRIIVGFAPGGGADIADPNMTARLVDLGGTVLALSPADFGKLIADDTEKWGKVMRAASIKAE